MGKVRRYSPEVRDRAIRTVVDHRGEYPSTWAAIQSVSQRLVMTPETLRAWVRQAEIDTGDAKGVTTEEKERYRQLEREVDELRRANEILRAASIFFSTERIGLSTKRNKCRATLAVMLTIEFHDETDYLAIGVVMILPPISVRNLRCRVTNADILTGRIECQVIIWASSSPDYPDSSGGPKHRPCPHRPIP